MAFSVVSVAPPVPGGVLVCGDWARRDKVANRRTAAIGKKAVLPE
jgi:hypothetical protein